MVESKKSKVESALAGLSEETEGLRSAVRKLAEENNVQTAMLAQMREDLAVLRADLDRAKSQLGKNPEHDNRVTRYN